MYPFGSGMPHPQSTPPLGGNPNANNRPAGTPFGAGWSQPPPVNSTPHAPYPPQAQQTPYPSGGPPYAQNQPFSTNVNPYPSSNNTSPYPPAQNTGGAPYPPAQNTRGAPYPPAQNTGGAPYPPAQNTGPYPSAQNTGPYPPAQDTGPYPPAHNPSSYPPPHNTSYQPAGNYQPASNYNANPPPQNFQSYQPNHGSQPIWGTGAPNTPSGNLAQCFNEMTRRQSQTQNFSHKREGTPVVFPEQNFDPVRDAQALRKAMKGFGTDEDALINIICRRTNEQRQEIQRQYKTNFGKDLVEDIKSETSGNFEKLLVGLLRPIVDFYCAEINDAISGLGTDEDVLIEILCTLSNLEIHTIKTQYLRLYGAHLESELSSETSGNFKRLLVSLCNANRDESGHVDPAAAHDDAKELLKAGELRAGTDESMFNMILCQRNYQQLKLIFQEYERITGHSLEKAIKKEFSGDIMDGLIAIYKCVTNKSKFFASRLHKSMAGIGTNDKQLIRVIITRSEIDLADIKVTFERVYGKSLKSWIKGDTSGHYKHALYALIGEQRSP